MTAFIENQYTKNSPFSRIFNIIKGQLNKLHYNTLVRVTKVYDANGKDVSEKNNNEDGQVFIDCVPLVPMMDASGKTYKHNTIFHIPVLRQSVGNASLIINPKVGQKGYIVVSGRDMTTAFHSQNTQQNKPMTARKYSWSDSFYIGSVQEEKPKVKIKISNDGDIEIITNKNVSVQGKEIDVKAVDEQGNKGNVKIDANEVDIKGKLNLTEDIKSDGDVKAGNISLKEHIHPFSWEGTSGSKTTQKAE